MKFTREISLIMLLVIMSLAGCSTYNSVQLKKENISSDYTYYKFEPPLYVGDRIKYTLSNGAKGEFTVKKIEPNSIVGDTGQTITLSELSSLEKKEISKGRTAAAVGGGMAATTVVLIVVLSVVIAGAIAGTVAAM